jgi:hypothetical protein
MAQINQNPDRNEKLRDFLPVTLFIAMTFLLEVFGLSKATNLVLSVFVSLFIFGVLSAMLREKYGDLPQLAALQKKTGLLSVVFLCILGIAFLHWYQILHVNLRWALFFVFLLLYFILLFRAVNLLHQVKMALKRGSK